MKSPRFGKRNLKRPRQKSAFWRFLPGAVALLISSESTLANTVPPLASAAQGADADSRVADYVTLATLFGDAPVVARVRVRKLLWIRTSKPEPAPMGIRRALIVADVVALLKAPAPLPPRIRFLIDVPGQSSGRNRIGTTQKEIMISARPVEGQGDEVQLLSRDSPLIWSEPLETRIRAIIGQFSAPGAPSAITGITGAFRVPGALVGESDTQIFMSTANGIPMSIYVLRSADAAPRWGAAFGDTVNSDAPPPRPDTVEWYRLACGLPRTLPPDALDQAPPSDREGISSDYAWLLQQLPNCAGGNRFVSHESRPIRGVPCANPRRELGPSLFDQPAQKHS